MRLAEAGALLATLNFEVLELPMLAERLRALRLRVGDPEWPAGVIAIDLRPSNETPGGVPPCESSLMMDILAAINVTGWTSILGVDTPGVLSLGDV
jgi:hypothetical protein